MRRLTCALAAMAVGGILGGCSQGNTGDAASAAAVPTPLSALIGTFLRFPNPQVQSDGTLQTDTAAYAQAYYEAIDPTSAKDTLAKWQAANGFGSGTGTEATVVFGDVRDLGYGRRMTGRQNPDGTLAFYVDNYIVTAGGAYSYSTLNLDAAVVQDRRWHVATNAIEFSPGPAGGVSFVKFYSFHPVTGARLLAANMDGRGFKALPVVCAACHGGRADPLTPPAGAGKPLFALMPGSASQARGDTLSQMMPLEVDTFDYSGTSGFTRSAQEATLKLFNRLILCAYPRAGAPAGAEDACRRAATGTEWQGSLAAVIKAGYGGDGLPNAVFSDVYQPAGWPGAGAPEFYPAVVAPMCRACHLARGTALQSDIDFNSFAKFTSFADRVRAHVIDRGNMPLASVTFDRFWSSGAPEIVANFLGAQGFPARDGAGQVLRPGRPVAVPGPDRSVRQGPVTLSASGSLFANTYNWSIVSGPNGAVPPANVTLTNATAAQATFNATADGTYVVQLVAGNGGTASTPALLTIVVNNALAPAPGAIRFADIKARLQPPATCANCHTPAAGAPIVFTNIDRNGDGTAGDATDDLWFYTEVRGRINFTDIAASPLLTKPSGRHHFGGQPAGFDATAAPGAAARANYDVFLNWILNGAPQ